MHPPSPLPFTGRWHQGWKAHPWGMLCINCTKVLLSPRRCWDVWRLLLFFFLKDHSSPDHIRSYLKKMGSPEVRWWWLPEEKWPAFDSAEVHDSENYWQICLGIKGLSSSGFFLLPITPACLALGQINENWGKLRLGIPRESMKMRGADGQGGMFSWSVFLHHTTWGCWGHRGAREAQWVMLGVGGPWPIVPPKVLHLDTTSSDFTFLLKTSPP